jgi:hypothetical protein
MENDVKMYLKETELKDELIGLRIQWRILVSLIMMSQ